MIFTFILTVLITDFAQAAHYKGGTITWKPTDPYTNASTVELTISQSHWWTLSYSDCNANIIHNQLWYGDYRTGTVGPPLIECLPSCSGTGWSNINSYTKCTDFSTTLDFSSGSLIAKRTLNRNTNIVIGFANGGWADVIRTNAGGSPGNWRVATKIDLSQKYPINSSPVTGSLPIIRVVKNRVAVIQIPAADWDVADDVRCRWASKTGTAGDECLDLCQNLPGAIIGLRDCTITWNAVLRTYDTSRGYTTSTYLAAIMVEDFVNIASTTPMSAVPIQMLIFVYTAAAGACNVTPAIIGDRPNRACIGVPIGVLLTERIVATVYCSSDTITEFITASPLFMNKTTIAPVSGVPNQWFITLRWTPTVDQKGPQVFCAAPIDQKGLTGSQHCINFVVGYAAPNLITPLFVQGSASPLGTVLSNHSIFTIQATSGVYHPNRNGTYVQIFNRANTTMPEWETDCGYSPNCIYTGSTVLFYVPNANWKYGAHYYILLSSGTASGNVFCAPESAPITDPSFWNFNIWDPGLSSTTSSSTTPPTTGTVTTRSLATTTPIANLTTTGIVITTPTTQTTTTLTTTTTSTTETTTSGTTTTATTTLPPVNIISATDFVEQCKQPVAIMNAVTMGVMAVVNVLGMFTMFTKLDKMFNPSRIAAQVRQQKFRNRIAARR